MRPPKLVAILSTVAPVLVLSAGCASIGAFSANPRTVCAGDAVTVTWAAVGDVTIGAEPAVPEVGQREPAGAAAGRTTSAHP